MSAVHAGRAPVAAAVAAVALLVAGVSVALGAEPSASPLAGDPRSAGEGPGLVGDPLLAIGGVVAIALVAVIGTLLWVRATAGSRERTPGP